MPAEVRLYERLFTVPRPDADKEHDFKEFINPDSLKVVNAYVEKAAVLAAPESHFQFERLGYFVADRYDHSATRPVFNRSVGLKDSWAKQQG